MEKKKILSVITIWLLAVVCAACVFSVVCTYLLLSAKARQDALKLVKQSVIDLILDGIKTTDIEKFYESDFYIAGIETADISKQAETQKYLDEHVLSYHEISVITYDGLITASTVNNIIAS